MPRRRAFTNILTLIQSFLEKQSDFCSASHIAEAVKADPRTVENHLDVLKQLGHIEEAITASGMRLVRWKKP